MLGRSTASPRAMPTRADHGWPIRLSRSRVTACLSISMAGSTRSIAPNLNDREESSLRACASIPRPLCASWLLSCRREVRLLHRSPFLRKSEMTATYLGWVRPIHAPRSWPLSEDGPSNSTVTVGAMREDLDVLSKLRNRLWLASVARRRDTARGSPQAATCGVGASSRSPRNRAGST
jgi:hypothetical protein